MLVKYFEGKLEGIKKLSDSDRTLKIIEGMADDVSEEKYFEMKGKVIEKLYSLGYKVECHNLVENFPIESISDFKLRSALSHILVRSSMIVDKIKNPKVQEIVNNFSPESYHSDHIVHLSINSAIILRKLGHTNDSIKILEKYDFLKNNILALLALSLNYHYIGKFEEESDIYERLQKFNENWVNDIIFFRKCRIFLEQGDKKRLKKAIKNCDIFSLLKSKEYRNTRCLELYNFFLFLGDECNALYYLEKSSQNTYNKNEVEVNSRKRALELLEKGTLK